MGIAGPQIGIGRAVALVRTPDGETITLINPSVIEETLGDEHYEGCLGFFDVRGVVNRPLTLYVEHQDIDGQRRITSIDRMAPGRSTIPVSEYSQGGQGWRY
jgi:peptide deformylase